MWLLISDFTMFIKTINIVITFTCGYWVWNKIIKGWLYAYIVYCWYVIVTILSVKQPLLKCLFSGSLNETELYNSFNMEFESATDVFKEIKRLFIDDADSQNRYFCIGTFVFIG